MKEQCYLGVDLGAESGRVMAGLWNGKRMSLQELHRFPNGPVEVAGTLRWDVLRLWSEIQHGLGVATRAQGQAIQSVGVDTWGVDFVLLSEGSTITLNDLPKGLRERTPSGTLGIALPDNGIMLEKHVAEYERTLLANALERAAGKKKEAALLLGLNKDQMKYLCRKYNL